MNEQAVDLRQDDEVATDFAALNRGYNAVFRPARLSLGLVAPVEAYANGPVPALHRHVERVRLAESLGFGAVWLRDVPFNVPSFGDAGQVHDPFVYLGLLAGVTERITLGVASLILPLRHPAHVAKAAASVDQLSGGRLVLGIASGDRPEEYPAMGVPFEERGDRFRASYEWIRRAGEQPQHASGLPFDHQPGTMELLPRPTGTRLPMLVTGSSQQAPDWLANHGDGWMTYPRPLATQRRVIDDWRARVRQAGRGPQPVLQPLYVDLAADPGALPRPIHLGYHLGVDALVDHLSELEQAGINHVALNLRFNRLDIEQTLERLAERVLPRFSD